MVLVLAQQQYFQDERFINYLSYLRYWKKPQYACYITYVIRTSFLTRTLRNSFRYPHSLYFLDLLQHERFRKELAKPDCVAYIHRQQFYHWLHYRNKRAHSGWNPGESEATPEIASQPAFTRDGPSA